MLKLYNDGAIGISDSFLDFASVIKTDNQFLIRSVRFMQVESLYVHSCHAEDIDFKFKMYVDESEYVKQPYIIVENGQPTTKTGTTDENGCFTLKHNQTARFENIPEDKIYKVQELGAFLNGYEVQVNGTTVRSPDNNGNGESIPTADSGNLSVATNPYLYCNCRPGNYNCSS